MSELAGHSAENGLLLTPEERAAKREAAVQGMVAKGYTRERAEEVLGMVSGALFAPGKRFGPPLPIHRTEAGYPRCSTCDGGGCLDCTDPA